MDRVLDRDHAAFPRRLCGANDAPERLYVRGTWSETELAVAIIGSRAASGDGRARAAELAAAVARAGGLVISGGALGIDAASHRGALEAGGLTAAVMGGGLENLYPRQNLELFAALAGITGLDEVRVARALVGLELSRLALAMPGSSYVRV